MRNTNEELYFFLLILVSTHFEFSVLDQKTGKAIFDSMHIRSKYDIIVLFSHANKYKKD